MKSLKDRTRKNIISLRVITMLLSVVWMCVIFSFSAQPALQSASASEDVSSMFIRIADIFSGQDLSDEQVYERAKAIDHVVRKIAHATEYAILAVTWFFVFAQYEKTVRSGYWLSQIVCSAYAVTDELHQFMSAGRSPSFRDVCIDSLGAFIALIVIWGISRCIISSSNRRRSAENR